MTNNILTLHVIYICIILTELILVCIPIILNNKDSYRKFFIKCFNKKPRLCDYKIYYNTIVFVVKYFKHTKANCETFEKAKKLRLEIYKQDLAEYNSNIWKEIPLTNEKKIQKFLKENPEMLEEL